MKFTIDKLTKEVAEKALDEITYEGKTIREWVEIIVKQQPCKNYIDKEALIEELKKVEDLNMTLDEAIKHCEEVAYRNELLMKRYDDASGYNRSHNEKIRTDGAKNCEQLISLYRQLAKWLRKLKAYESDDEICKYCTHTHDADYCNMCKHNTIFVDYFDLEGKADE